MKKQHNPERLKARWWVALIIACVFYFYTIVYK